MKNKILLIVAVLAVAAMAYAGPILYNDNIKFSKVVEIAGSIIESYETVAATNTLTVAECGKVMTLSHATEFVTTLPAPTAGCRFTFIVANAPETASYTIVTSGSSNIIHGQVASAEDALGSVATAASSDTITFVDAKAIIGDYVEVVSDGTSWFVSGLCNVQDGITTTQAS